MIYDNDFDNVSNIAPFVGTNTNNAWNINPTAGTNIIGGPDIAGNFWGNPSGTGFSQICQDLNLDGICDSSYAIDSEIIDYFPLAVPDTTPPTISLTCPATAYLKSYATALVEVSDTRSGVASRSAPNGVNALDTSTVGTKTFTVTATDNAGNTGSNSCTYQVIYDFLGSGGFHSPLANPPVTKSAKAGSTVPVKWQLPDGQGGYISDLSVVVSITFQQVQCSDLSTSLTNEVPTTTSGGSGLHYDAITNQFIYNWKTKASMAGPCYGLILRLSDGSEYRAYFSLK